MLITVQIIASVTLHHEICNSAFSILAIPCFAGPIFPSRSIILAPQFRSPLDTTKGALFLRQQGIWGNLARGFGSENNRQGWSISTGGILQFVEWQNAMIYMTGDFDVLADTYNDISFNPRDIFWTEGVCFGYRFDETELAVGYIHRCHHDIDNLDSNTVGTGERRTLIYGSLMARGVWRDMSFFRRFGIQGSFWAQLDQYLIKQDTRRPDQSSPRPTDMEKLNSSISVGGKIGFLFLGDISLYLRIVHSFSAYDSYKTWVHDSRGELGLEFIGEALSMNVFFGAESLQDDLNRPSPHNSSYSYIGIRFTGRNIGL